jgi:hypothetical protein
MIWKKRMQLNWGIVPAFREELRKTMKDRSQDSLYPCQNLNWGPPEFESRAFSLVQPIHWQNQVLWHDSIEWINGFVGGEVSMYDTHPHINSSSGCILAHHFINTTCITLLLVQLYCVIAHWLTAHCFRLLLLFFLRPTVSRPVRLGIGPPFGTVAYGPTNWKPR